MEYNGYHAVVTFDDEVGILHGEVIDTRDVITFQGKSVDELEQAFRASVGEYLKICEERGRVPDRPFSGRVVLRMEPETHRAVAGAARTSGKSLNSWILEAIDRQLTRADEERHSGAYDLEILNQADAAEFEVFLREAWRRHSQQEPVSPVIPFWMDWRNGRMWTSDVQPAHEVFTFEAKAPYPNSIGYSPFTEFLTDEVNLSQNRLDRLETSVGAVNDYLKDSLAGYQKMEQQGSYALGTLIKPMDDNNEYDVDIQVMMNPNPKWEPEDYVNEVFKTLQGNKNYVDKLRLKTRCATIDYAGDFHLDVVPCVTSGGRHYICNRVDNQFEQTDGTGYRDWFNERNRITGGNLKRVVRLLKYTRDHKNSFTAKSILLTTLAGDTIKPSDAGTEAVSTVADTLETVLTRMNGYLQQHPNMPAIRNPALPTETFNRHWDQRRYANFKNRVQAYARAANQAKAEPSSEKAIKLWQDLFGDTFGATTSSGGGGGGTNVGGGRNPSPQNPNRGAHSTVAPAVAIPVAPRRNEAQGFGQTP